MAFYPIPDDQDFQPIHCQPLTEPVPTDPTPNRPPLWQVMKAADASCTSDLTIPEAKAIRAIADWLVPEEDVKAEGEHYQARQIEREYQRDILLDEVRRAEAGEP